MPPRARRPRGHIRELPSGSLQAVVYVGLDPITKKERYLRETARDENEAKTALTRLLQQVDEDRHPKKDLTVRQAIDQWLGVAKLEDTTRDRYDDLIRLYIGPTLGHVKAAQLGAELLERWYSKLQRCRITSCDGGPRSGHKCKPLSSSTVRKIHFILSAAIGRAVRWEHLSVNKAQLAQPPSPAPADPDPPSAAEAARLLSAAWSADPEWGLLLWLTMVAGARRGEISALRWAHVDLTGAVVTLHRANAQPKSGLKEKDTKSGQKRRIVVDPHTLTLLVEHRARIEQRCGQLGIELRPEMFLFSPAADGSTPWPPRSLTLRFARLARKLDLASTRLHSLRHYTATELIAAGTNIRTVAGRLGHGSGGATTLRVYAAWVSEADQRAATTIGGIMPTLTPAPRPPRGPYEVIAGQLREQITDGRLPPGAPVPTIAELASGHSVSVGTAHRAITLLATEGLIDVSRGRRATVRQAPDPAGLIAAPQSMRDIGSES